MAESLPKETKAELKRFKGAVEKLDGLAKSFCSRDPRQVDAEETPVQRAQTHLAVAQALHHVFLLYLRTHGLDTPGHPITKEAERLKAYARKVRRLESADYSARTRPTTEVNVAAANRFIDAAIPDLSQEQRQALKQAGKDSAQQKQQWKREHRQRKQRQQQQQQPQRQQQPQPQQQPQEQQPQEQQQAGAKRKQPEPGSRDTAGMARAFLQQAFGKPTAVKVAKPAEQRPQ